MRDHFERRWGACDTSRSSFELPLVVLWHACLPRSGERKNMNLPNVHARELQSFVCHRSLSILLLLGNLGYPVTIRDCEVRGEHGKKGPERAVYHLRMQVKVDLPVLQPKDIDDLQNFAVGRMFSAASGVQRCPPRSLGPSHHAWGAWAARESERLYRAALPSGSTERVYPGREGSASHIGCSRHYMSPDWSGEAQGPRRSSGLGRSPPNL